MLPCRDGAIAVAGKSVKEIQETVKNVYNDRTLKNIQLYEIIRKRYQADQRLFKEKRKVRFPVYFADVAAEVANDRHVTVRILAQAHTSKPKRFTPLSQGGSLSCSIRR
jgi:hypothetical protein